ncbi:hypothetical protein B0H13DRAFT_1864364 [Mycena leptocephala]|nr:hypothetical protein B0H13DRAFT_1864364 [Mycena leptocephala]
MDALAWTSFCILSGLPSSFPAAKDILKLTQVLCPKFLSVKKELVFTWTLRIVLLARLDLPCNSAVHNQFSIKPPENENQFHQQTIRGIIEMKNPNHCRPKAEVQVHMKKNENESEKNLNGNAGDNGNEYMEKNEGK